MVKKLRKGLIDPFDVPENDIPNYMADTYRGYMIAIRERIKCFENFKDFSFGKTELNNEFFALQIRLILELIAFMVSTFHQSTTKPISKGRRSKYHPEEVLKDVEKYINANNVVDLINNMDTTISWLTPADPNFNFSFKNKTIVLDIPNIKVKDFEDYNGYKTIYGKLGNILHEQQRPRQSKKPMDKDQINIIFNQLKLFITKHSITDLNGDGWYIDATMTTQPGGIGIIKISKPQD